MKLMIIWCQVVRHTKEIAEKILQILFLPIALPLLCFGEVANYLKKRKKHTVKEVFKYIIKKESFWWSRSTSYQHCILLVVKDGNNDTLRYGADGDVVNPMFYVPFDLCKEQREKLLNDYCPKGATRITFHNGAWHEKNNIEYNVSQQRRDLLKAIGFLDDYTYCDVYEQEQDMTNNTHILFIF